jgi:micrococcal nuclease
LLAAIAVSFGVSQPGIAYLNFGEDWHTDFTVEIERKDKGAFVAAGLDLGLALAGMHMRVRGWIEWLNGPMIHTTHPKQIELLPPASGPESASKPEPPGVAL